MRKIIVFLVLGLSGCMNIEGYKIRFAVEFCKDRESKIRRVNEDWFECSDGRVEIWPGRPD